MNDFLTEKNKKTGVLGKLKWVLCGFCILFTLGAIGAAEKYIGEGRWGMAATEIILGLLFLYPTFREIQKALKKKKARENLVGNNSVSLLTKEIRVLMLMATLDGNTKTLLPVSELPWRTLWSDFMKCL